MLNEITENRNIIIFDGICNLCNSGIKFIIKRDPKKLFCFVPMQSDISQKLIEKHYNSEFNFDTFILIKNRIFYERSDAVLEVVRDLNGYWYLLRLFVLVPKPMRDYIYNVIARNRYKIFGKRDQCMAPHQDIKARFLQS